MPLRASRRERLRIAVAEIQGLSILEGIKAVLCAGNQNFDCERDGINKLSQENCVVCIATEDFRDNLIFLVQQLYTKTIPNCV